MGEPPKSLALELCGELLPVGFPGNVAPFPMVMNYGERDQLVH